MKKLAITLGSIAAAAIPVATAVSCSVFSDDESTKSQGFASARKLTVDGSNGHSTGITKLTDELKNNVSLLPGMAKDVQNEDTRYFRFNITFADGILKFWINLSHTGQGVATVHEARWDANNGWAGDFNENKVHGSASIINYVNLLFQGLMKAQVNGTADQILTSLISAGL